MCKEASSAASLLWRPRKRAGRGPAVVKIQVPHQGERSSRPARSKAKCAGRRGAREQTKKKEKLRWRTAAVVRRASPGSKAKMSSGWPQSSVTTQKAGPEATAGQGRPAARFLFALFQFLPPRLRPGARGLGWLGARASAWRPAGRDGAARGAGAGVRRARRAGGGGGGGGRGAAAATCGPAGDPGSGRSTPPAARTAATGSSRNSCSRTPPSRRPWLRSQYSPRGENGGHGQQQELLLENPCQLEASKLEFNLGHATTLPLRAPPAATPQLRAPRSGCQWPPSCTQRCPRAAKRGGGATLPTLEPKLMSCLSQNGRLGNYSGQTTKTPVPTLVKRLGSEE